MHDSLTIFKRRIDVNARLDFETKNQMMTCTVKWSNNINGNYEEMKTKTADSISDLRAPNQCIECFCFKRWKKNYRSMPKQSNLMNVNTNIWRSDRQSLFVSLYLHSHFQHSIILLLIFERFLIKLCVFHSLSHVLTLILLHSIPLLFHCCQSISAQSCNCRLPPQYRVSSRKMAFSWWIFSMRRCTVKQFLAFFQHEFQKERTKRRSKNYRFVHKYEA